MISILITWGLMVWYVRETSGVDGLMGVSEELVGPMRMALLVTSVFPSDVIIIGGKSERGIVFAMAMENIKNKIVVDLRKKAIIARYCRVNFFLEVLKEFV